MSQPTSATDTGHPNTLATDFSTLRGKRAGVILYSLYLIDPRARRAAEAMRACGMKVDVLCISEGSHEPRTETADGVRITRLAMTHQRQSKVGYLWNYARFFLASFWFLTWKTARNKYDVVHVHNMPDVLVFSALFAKFRGARVILDLHDPMPELMMNIYSLSAHSWPVRLLRLLERWSIGFSDVVLTPNLTFKNLFVSRSCRPEKMHIVMNSPLPEVFSLEKSAQRERPRDQFRLMHHGSILHRHGVDVLVDAVALLRERIPGLHLDIYGLHTAFTDEVLAQIRRLGLEQLVTYHGPKTQAEIVAAINETDLGLVPNRRSAFTELNFPTRIFEYLALRRPVIVPSTQGIRDYFQPDEMLMFDPGDAADLSEKIFWVWCHPAETAAILERGIGVYRQNLWTDQRTLFLKCAVGCV